MRMRILLADEHQLVREGLRSLLERQPDLQVVGEAMDGKAAVRLAQELHPDVIIMDIGMPLLNGIDATQQIRHRFPDIKVLALSMHNSREMVVSMMKAGAAGYVLKEEAFKDLVTAIQTVLHGQPYLSPRIAGIILEDYLPRVESNEDPSLPHLTPREHEVLLLLSAGKSTKEIALTLDISVKTVDRHRQQLMEKLGVHGVADLIRFAFQHKMIPLDPA